MRLPRSLLTLFVCLNVWHAPALAHEFIITPQLWHAYAEGQRVPIAVHTAHVLTKSDELENKNDVVVTYAGQSVSLTSNDAWLTLDGVVHLQDSHCALIAGHRKRQVWSETEKGTVPGGRQKYPGASYSATYEKFAKLLLPVSGEVSGFDRLAGHRLEIVPIDNPLTARVGDTIRVNVLFDNKPAKFTRIQASYDGFSDIADAWAWSAPPTSHGQAQVKLSHSGLWHLIVAITVPEKTAESDETHIKAVLSFPVQ